MAESGAWRSLAGYNDYSPSMKETCINYFIRCLRKYVEDCVYAGVKHVFFFALDERYTIDTGYAYGDEAVPKHESAYRLEFNSCLRGLQNKYPDVVKILGSHSKEWREAFRHGSATPDQYHHTKDEQWRIGETACKLIIEALETQGAINTRVLLFTDSTLKSVNTAVGKSHACYDRNGNEVRALVVRGAGLCRKRKTFKKLIPFIFPHYAEWLWEACDWKDNEHSRERYNFVQGMDKVHYEGFYWPESWWKQKELEEAPDVSLPKSRRPSSARVKARKRSSHSRSSHSDPKSRRPSSARARARKRSSHSD